MSPDIHLYNPVEKLSKNKGPARLGLAYLFPWKGLILTSPCCC